MEILAVLAGLEVLKRPCLVQVVSDSKYVVDSMNGDWPNKWKAELGKVSGGLVENIDLWERMLEQAYVHKLSFEWVKVMLAILKTKFVIVPQSLLSRGRTISRHRLRRSSSS